MSNPNAKRPCNCNLPEDAILEILLRLPVKSLSRFKCVCKNWYALIGSWSFVNRHFGHESNREHLLIRHYKPNEGRHAFALFMDKICSQYEEPDHLQMPDTVRELIGPVNGIFCVVGENGNIALLNPAMRQFKPLPELCLVERPDSLTIHNAYGFGLDLLKGNYKLVKIDHFGDKERDAGRYCHVFSVYNSGKDSWRYFEDASLNKLHCVCRPLCNTYLEGVYYWPMEYGDGNAAAILAFDMATENFKEIQVPDCVKSKQGSLALYGDSIALVAYDSFEVENICFDIWVMRKDRCWIKRATVGPFQDNRWAVGFWKNHELLFETGTSLGDSLLTLCNVFTQKLRTVEALSKDNFIYRIFSYQESLFSLKGIGKKKRKRKGLGDNFMLWDTSSDFFKHFFQRIDSSSSGSDISKLYLFGRW